MIRKMLNICCLLGLVGLVTVGCSTMSESNIRDLNRMADNSVAKMVLEQPGLQAELGVSAGSVAFEWSGSIVPMVGNRGDGMLIDPSSDERTPIRITDLEIDGAQGLGGFTGVMLIRDVASFRLAKTEGLTLENSGTLYIYVQGEPSAAYAVKRITIALK